MKEKNKNVMYSKSDPHCLECGRRPADGAKFGVRADTKKNDDLCVRCRFEWIDGKHANARGIREDMKEYGIDVAGRSARLRFEPGADGAERMPDDVEEEEL